MMAPQKNRYYEIDLFRFLAAVSVVLFHYTFSAYYSGNSLMKLSFPVLGSIFKYGYLGVNFFFMISGFVILLTAYKKGPAEFAVSRISRLYPAFWTSVTITTLVTLSFGGTEYTVYLSQYLYNLTMLSGFFNVPNIDSVYWTLLVELKFYFLIIIIILLGRISKAGIIFGIWIALSIFLSLCCNVKVISFFIFPDWSSYFIAGATFFLIRKEGLNTYKITVLFLSYGLSIFHAGQQIYRLEALYQTPFSHAIIFSIITLFYLVLFLVSLGKTELFQRKFFVKLGALTYPLYLIHQNIGIMLFNMFSASVNKYILLGLIICVMLVISFGIHTYIEKRFSKPLGLLIAGAFSSVSKIHSQATGKYLN